MSTVAAPQTGTTEWTALARRLRQAHPEAHIVLRHGWNLALAEADHQRYATTSGGYLPVRVLQDEVLVGPRWGAAEEAGCPGCAEFRERSISEHPLVVDLGEPRARFVAHHPVLPALVATAIEHLADNPLAAGELLAISARGLRRHKVLRSIECPVCAEPATDPTLAPEPLTLHPRPALEDDPTRAEEGRILVRHNYLRDKLVDHRFGPVRAMLREAKAPFAMSAALLPDSPNMGYGRALRFAETEAVAIIEAYERLAGFPFDSPVLTDTSYDQLGRIAVDPSTLGQYSPTQLAHPSCKVDPSDNSTPMDWVWGHDLATRAPRLVPADIAFFQWEYRFRRARRLARRAGPAAHRKFFHESSSGCAAGSSLEEATLHSLLELAERDAFLLAWHRGSALPRVRNDSIDDAECSALIELIESRGCDLHVLVATADIALPVVWVLAVNRDGVFPATFSSGGSGANPLGAIRGALREVAQLVTMDKPWDLARLRDMFQDPWQLEELEEHPMLGSIPEMLPRVCRVTGGPQVTLHEAFPGWPEKLTRASGQDVTGSLGCVRDLFADAGLREIVVVDQTSREHRDAGVSVAKAVVPGIVPMCFGYAQQRLLGLPRFTAATANARHDRPDVPFDPHPFP